MDSAWTRRLRTDAGMSLAALADQIVVSGTNFAVGILIARFCSVSDYGTYVVAFTCLLTLNQTRAAQ